MKYLIARKVIYDTEGGKLTVDDINACEETKLTNTANRILTLLVASPGTVLERNYILDKVWHASGLEGSSASLNQYISILRKTLTSLTDIQETIISQPRVGFFLSPDIDVQVCDAAPQTQVPATRPAKVKNKRQWSYLAMSVAAIALIGANLWLSGTTPSGSRYTALYDIGALGQCALKAYENKPATLEKKTTEVLLTLQPALREKCQQQPALIISQIQRSVFYGSGGRVFYAFCPLDTDGKQAIYCENHYAFNWKMK